MSSLIELKTDPTFASANAQVKAAMFNRAAAGDVIYQRLSSSQKEQVQSKLLGTGNTGLSTRPPEVTGAQNLAEQELKDLKTTSIETKGALGLEGGSKVGQEAATGAVGGAITGIATPEILEATGKILARTPNPLVKTAGAGLIGAGELMSKGVAARLSMAVDGMISGAASNAAAQKAREDGHGEVTSFIIGALGGATTQPITYLKNAFLAGTHSLVGMVARQSLHAPAGAESEARKLAVGTLTGDSEGKHAPLLANAAFKASVDKLSQVETQRAQATLKQKLDEAARMTITDPQGGAAAAQRAKDEFRDSQERLRKTLEDTKNNLGPEYAYADVIQKKAEVARNELLGSAISDEHAGQEIQQTVQKNAQDIKDRASAQYERDKTKVNQVVQEKQAAGKFPSITPRAAALIKRLEAELYGSKTAPFRNVTAPLQRKALENFVAAIKPLAKEMPDGSIVKLPPTYHALEGSLQELGDAGFSEKVLHAEGFAGLKGHTARDLYNELRALQANYVGKKLYNRMQGNYAASKTVGGRYAEPEAQLAMTGSKLDYPAIAQKYLKTAKGAQILKGLLEGDSAADPAAHMRANEQVFKLAKGYLSNALQDASSASATAWMKSNKDFFNAFPMLREQAQKYIAKVSEIEEAPKKLARDHKDIETAYKETMKSIHQIPTKGMPLDDAEKLLTSRDPKTVERAFNILEKTPEGTKIAENMVRQQLSRASPKNFRRIWETSAPHLERMAGTAAEKAAFKKLDLQVRRYLEEGKTHWAMSVARNAIIGGVSQGPTTLIDRALHPSQGQQ